MPDQSEGPQKRDESLARGDAPSHRIVLPGVKIDLAVVVLLLACLWFVVAIADLSRAAEAAALLAGSATVCGWLAWRTRRAVMRVRQQSRSDHGAE